MELAFMQGIADRTMATLAPYCHRIEIAGSIRREVPDPRDIEIVCVPKGHELMDFVGIVRKWPKIKGEPTGKYTQRNVEGVNLDLFITTLACWAVIFTIRTGSATFSYNLMIWARQHGFCFKNGRLWHLIGSKQMEVINIPEERDLFRVLGRPWVEPQDRK